MKDVIRLIKNLERADYNKLLTVASTNIIPVVGLLFFGWDYRLIIIYFWFEGIIFILFSSTTILRYKKQTILSRILTFPVFFLITCVPYLAFYLGILGMMSSIIFQGSGFIDFSILLPILKQEAIFLLLFIGLMLQDYYKNNNPVKYNFEIMFMPMFLRTCVIFLALWISAAVFSKLSIIFIPGLVLILYKSIMEGGFVLSDISKSINERNRQIKHIFPAEKMFIAIFCLLFISNLFFVILLG
jgi:hypothetical protein